MWISLESREKFLREGSYEADGRFLNVLLDDFEGKKWRLGVGVFIVRLVCGPQGRTFTTDFLHKCTK